MAYNSAYSGPQIDEAIGKALSGGSPFAPANMIEISSQTEINITAAHMGKFNVLTEAYSSSDIVLFDLTAEIDAATNIGTEVTFMNQMVTPGREIGVISSAGSVYLLYGTGENATGVRGGRLTLKKVGYMGTLSTWVCYKDEAVDLSGINMALETILGV